VSRASASGNGTVSLPVPVVVPHLKVLHVPAPGMPHVSVSGAGHALADRVPPREQLAYYGGLGMMAAFGMISWPVAAAIGVGIAVAKHARGAGKEGTAKKKPSS
jgi:hypothetical protein